MADYRWIITEDYFDGKSVGTEGPSRPNMSVKPNHRFRMFDGDGELSLEGLIGGYYDGFEPLDDFGEGYMGCAEIHYLNDGKWEVL